MHEQCINSTIMPSIPTKFWAYELQDLARARRRGSTAKEEEDPVTEATMADANEFPTPKQGDDGTKTVEMSNAGEASTSRGKEVDVVIEIKDDDESCDGRRYNDWARSINEKCYELERSNERRIPKIPRVPQQHRQGDNEAYEPWVISIGPYHRGNPRLQRMENQKLACVRQLVNRCSVVHFLREIEAMESRARSCYSENINLKSKEFVEMMLMDGCFIVFYLLKPRQLNGPIHVFKKCQLNNPIRMFEPRQLNSPTRMHLKTPGFEYLPGVLNCPSWMHDEIRNDLILLENQLPFFVVEHTYSLVKSEDDPLLMDLAHSFCGRVSPINSKDLCSVKQTVHHLLVHHLLHLYHWFLFSTIEVHHMSSLPNTSGMTVSATTGSPAGSTSCLGCIDSFFSLTCVQLSLVLPIRLLCWLSEGLSDWLSTRLPNFRYWLSSNSTTNSSHLKKSKCTIGSATFLEEAGIKFRKKKQVTDSIMDAEFTNGVMEITPLFIDVFTVSQFRNLIALEKSDHYLEPQVIAFARFMDYIISTSKDVALLRKKGIIQHAFGSDEEVATIFNQLTSGTLEYQTPKLTKMYEDVDEYCKSKRHQWRAILMRDYFGSPWAAISLVAAVILISLTFLQTYFSMYSYFRPP